MMLADIVFIGLASLVIIGAVLAVGLPNVFYNALSLILCLFAVAGLFIFLHAEFLAIIEVIVYIGAISIAIIFAIMLSKPMTQKSIHAGKRKTARSLLIAGLLFVALSKALSSTHWPVASTDGDYSLGAVGKNLLTAQALPFELISLVLLVAIIGALVISSPEKST